MTSIKKFGSFINETDSYKENGRFTYKGNDVVLAGKSKYPVGTKIKIKKLNGEDKELSGLTGTLTHPFAFGSGDVGVYLDKKGVYTDDKVNLKNSEYDVVDDEALKLIKKNESLKTYENIDMSRDQHLMSIRIDGKKLIGHIEIKDGKIVTTGFIGENVYDNFVDLIRGLQGFDIKIDDFFF